MGFPNLAGRKGGQYDEPRHLGRDLPPGECERGYVY